MNFSMGGGGTTPPDYMNLANLQGQWNQSLLNQQTWANRPNIETPWGSTTWDRPDTASQIQPYQNPGGSFDGQTVNMGGTQYGTTTDPSTGEPMGVVQQPLGGAPAQYSSTGGGAPVGSSPTGERGPGYPPADNTGGYGMAYGPQTGDPGVWTEHVNLTPQQQAIFNAQQGIQAGRSNFAGNMLNQVQQNFQHPLDYSGLGQLPDAAAARNQAIQANYGQATSRLDPQWNQRLEEEKNQLYAQGLRPGSEAYDREMATFNRNRNDAYTSAMNNAIGQGNQTEATQFGIGLQGRQQGISELLQQREQPFNEMQSLLGGQQVGMPQMPGFSQAGVAASPNLLGAGALGYQGALNQYGQQQAGAQSLMNGIGGLASMAPFMF